MARISCTAGYHRTLATACVLQAVLSAPLLHCDVRTGSENCHLIHFSLPIAWFSGCWLRCHLHHAESSAKTGSAMPACAGGGMRHLSKRMKSSLGEVVMQDILRRWHEESEQQLSLEQNAKGPTEDLHCICQTILGNNGFLAY